MKKTIFYNHREELWNSWSHAAGMVLAATVGCIYIIWCISSGDVWGTIGVSLYLFGMMASYLSSTVYHALSAWSVWKDRLRKWDHAAIYWHIAGAYSPITLVALREADYWGWGLFAFVWLCAGVGTLMSFRHLSAHSNLETLCFVGMGLSVLVAFKPLTDNVSLTAVAWLIAEGVAYITGAVFYSLNKRKYMHTVFHFFVLLGEICHAVAVGDILSEYLSPL